MSMISDTVRALNLVRQDRDELRSQLIAKENEISELKKQVIHPHQSMKYSHGTMSSDCNKNNDKSNCNESCQCNCHQMVELALEQFQVKLDVMLERLDGVLLKDFSGGDDIEKKLKKNSDSLGHMEKGSPSPSVSSPCCLSEGMKYSSVETPTLSDHTPSSLSSSSLRAKLSKAAKRSSRQSFNNSSEKEKVKDTPILLPSGGDAESTVSTSTSISLDATVRALSFLNTNSSTSISREENSEISSHQVDDKSYSGSSIVHSDMKSIQTLSPEKVSARVSTSPEWNEVVKFADAPAYDLDSPIVLDHLKSWSPNSEKRLYLCQWFQDFIADLNPEPQIEDLLLRGMSTSAKESFIVMIIPILRDKRPDIPLFAYCRESSLNVGARDLGADNDMWDLKLTTKKVESKTPDEPINKASGEKCIEYSTSIQENSLSVIVESTSTSKTRNSPSKPLGTPPRPKQSPPISPNRNRRSNFSRTRPSSSRSSIEGNVASIPPKSKSTSDILTDAIDLSSNKIHKEGSTRDENKAKFENSKGRSSKSSIRRLHKNIALTNRVQATLQNLQDEQGEI